MPAVVHGDFEALDARHGRTVPRKSTLIYSHFHLARANVRFIQTCAKRLGISQAEFVRRLVGEAEMVWVRAGVYQMKEEE
jgi:hypothetical protein